MAHTASLSPQRWATRCPPTPTSTCSPPPYGRRLPCTAPPKVHVTISLRLYRGCLNALSSHRAAPGNLAPITRRPPPRASPPPPPQLPVHRPSPHLPAHTLTSQFAFSIFIMSSHGEDAASSPSTLNPSSSTSYAPFDHNSNIIAANEALVLYCRRSPFPPIFQNSKPLIIFSQRAGGQTPQSSIWLRRRRWRVLACTGTWRCPSRALCQFTRLA